LSSNISQLLIKGIKFVCLIKKTRFFYKKTRYQAGIRLIFSVSINKVIKIVQPFLVLFLIAMAATLYKTCFIVAYFEQDGSGR